jgi:hypothetical protein
MLTALRDATNEQLALSAASVMGGKNVEPLWYGMLNRSVIK